MINLKFKKAGKIVAIVFTIVALLPFLSLAFEDYFFFQSDAKKMLKENKLELLDNFTIESNKITGMSDLYQIFELQISEKDKERIIRQIRNSPYFKGSANEDYTLSSEVGSGLTKKIYCDYEKREVICRETYQKLRQGYASDYDIISISKTGNTLSFERMND